MPTSVAVAMSTHADTDDATATDASASSPRRIRPHQVVAGAGIALGLATIGSGVFTTIVGWENENAVHRTVFGNIPGPLKIAFYTVVPVVLAWVAFKFADRMKNWERGAPDRRRTTAKNAKRRLRDFRAGVDRKSVV